MIFDKSLDKALWLMLYSDKNNRGRIISFIKDIPGEVFEKLRILLDEYFEYENKDVSLYNRRDFCLKEEINIFKYKYVVDIDMYCHSLSIVEYDSFNKETRKLVIYFDNRINNIELLGSQKLGSFYTDCGNDIVSVSYDLVDSLLGKMVACSDISMYKKFKKIFIDDIPCEYSLEDFFVEKKFVRRKSKTS